MDPVGLIYAPDGQPQAEVVIGRLLAEGLETVRLRGEETQLPQLVIAFISQEFLQNRVLGNILNRAMLQAPWVIPVKVDASEMPLMLGDIQFADLSQLARCDDQL